jgi:hypothetical protein
LGRWILERSEAEAARAGFTALELMATLPGQRLYTRCSIRGLAGCSSVPADAKSIHLKGAGEVDGISR